MTQHTDVEPQPKRSVWTKVPGLAFLAPPDTTPRNASDVEAAQVAGEVDPTALPGSRLRVSARDARNGRYAPALAGAPSTTRQAEILNTALIAPPTGSKGVPNGRDVLSRSLVAHDPATAYNEEPRETTSPNACVFGTVGVGKTSFTMTTFGLRPLVLRRRSVVVFDKKPDADDKEQGEYAASAYAFGTEPIRFTADSTGTRLNIFDPLVSAGTGATGVYSLLLAVTEYARGGEPLGEWEKKAIRAALRATLAQFEGRRTPTVADLLPHLGRIEDHTDLVHDLRDSAKDKLHEAGLSVRWTLEDLLEVAAGLIDGETSSTVNLDHNLTVFDLSQLPDDGPAIPVTMAIGNMWLMGRLRRRRGAERRLTNVIYEEGWHMIGGPAARLVRSNEKLSRALGLTNVFVMHKGTDIPKDSPGYAVIQEAQTVYAFRQDRPEDAQWAVNTFALEPDTRETLMNLPVGHCVMKIGSRPEIQLQHVRSRWEVALTDSDGAMAVAAQESERG